MDKFDLSEKNKNKLLNLGILLIAAFAAFQIYKSANSQINDLTSKKNNELKKNEAMEEIAGLETKMDSYKKVFPRRDITYVLDAISKIANESQVKLVSIKPMDDDVSSDYIKSSYFITVASDDYHALADFISKIEGSKDIYFVGEIAITSAVIDYSAKGSANASLTLNLKINTIMVNNG